MTYTKALRESCPGCQAGEPHAGCAVTNICNVCMTAECAGFFFVGDIRAGSPEHWLELQQAESEPDQEGEEQEGQEGDSEDSDPSDSEQDPAPEDDAEGQDSEQGDAGPEGDSEPSGARTGAAKGNSGGTPAPEPSDTEPGGEYPDGEAAKAADYAEFSEPVDLAALIKRANSEARKSARR